MYNTDKFNTLAETLKKGDARAAQKIFDHFAPSFHSFFMARVGNRETAQDLTQEVFLKVIKSIEQFNMASGNFTAWIWQIARNSGTDYYRRKKTLYLSDLPEEGANLTDDNIRADVSAKTREIMNIVKRLPGDEQELFNMHFVADMAYVNMARATGRSESNLRVAIHRLRKKIMPLLV